MSGLASVLERLRDARRTRILDLGPAVGLNLEVYAHVASRVCFADLLADAVLDDGSGLQTPVLLPTPLEAVIPAPDPPFGVVLTWDQLCFLGRDETSSLVHRMVEVSAPGAVLHALVASDGDMSARPARYVLEGTGRVRCELLTDERMPAPSLAPAEVERRLAPFRVERSVLLRDGVRELVAVLAR